MGRPDVQRRSASISIERLLGREDVSVQWHLESPNALCHLPGCYLQLPYRQGVHFRDLTTTYSRPLPELSVATQILKVIS
jgi:hypothetical protein